MIQNLQDSCKNLARYQSRPKNKSGYKCFRKHLWSKFLLTEQVTKPNSMKTKLARIQNLARILQESCKILNSAKNFYVFLVAKNNWKPNIMTDIRILDQQNWKKLNDFFRQRLLNVKSCKNLARFLQDFDFKYNFPTNKMK